MASTEKKEAGSGSDRERVRAQVGEATSEPLIGGRIDRTKRERQNPVWGDGEFQREGWGRGRERVRGRERESERRHNGEETEETGSGKERERRGWVINAGV
jgi:hypothetical protein